VRAVRSLIHTLSGSKALTVRNKRLACDLAALGALVSFLLFVLRLRGFCYWAQ
jgi:hypothetical protein